MAITTFFGLNTAPVAAVVGDPVTAKASFLAALVGTVSDYTFESRSNGDTLPIVAAFVNAATGLTTNVTMTSTSVKYTPTVKTSASSGRFNTTAAGVCYLQVSAELTPQTIVFTPSRNISAFGFYATDVGDFGGVFSVRLTAVGGATTTIVVTDNSAGNYPSGALLFWGFADPATAYTKVEIIASGPSDTLGTFDYFGFDDFVIAEPSQVQPAPDFWPAGCQAWPAGLPVR